MTKDEVIKSSLWQATVYAAFQRAKVYSGTATDIDKRGIKQTLEKEINARLPKYVSAVSETTHVKHIEAIAQNINNTEWSSALEYGKIPIGVVQKAFNLYLKFMWCLKKIHEPPHCPVDKVIIDKLPYKDRKSWTKIRDIQTYETLVNQLKELAKNEGKTLSLWELEVYEKP